MNVGSLDDVQTRETELANAQAEVEKWKDAALHAQADMENYRKRMTVEKSDAIRYANQALIESMLSILDNFHFGIEAARSSANPDTIVTGMEMVLKQINNFLGSNQVTEIETEVGDSFDPDIHDAVSEEQNETVPTGTVIRIIRRGYYLGDRLLRAAGVVVSTRQND